MAACRPPKPCGWGSIPWGFAMNNECVDCEKQQAIIVQLLKENSELQSGLEHLLVLDFSDIEAKNSYINLLLIERI